MRCVLVVIAIILLPMVTMAEEPTVNVEATAAQLATEGQAPVEGPERLPEGLKVGMTEAEVVGLLGTTKARRGDGRETALFYGVSKVVFVAGRLVRVENARRLEKLMELRRGKTEATAAPAVVANQPKAGASEPRAKTPERTASVGGPGRAVSTSLTTKSNSSLGASGDITRVDTAGHSNLVSVKGHYRKDGTYVPGHVRTAPDRTTEDNLGSSVGHRTADSYVAPSRRKSPSSSSSGGVWVNGYTRKNGTYVAGHYRKR